MSEAIRLDAVTRRFQVGEQWVHALEAVSLSVQHGEYLAIMGPSGSGKSTLLNLLGLLDRPDEGAYFLDGQDTGKADEAQRADLRRNHIGFIFQSFHLIPRLTAEANVELPMVLAGLDPNLRRQRAEAALEAVGLSDRAHHHPDQLSGGQRQRVAIARATVMRPEVLLADEPTGNLDQHSGAEIIELLESLNRQGLTVILVTHDPTLGQRTQRLIQLVDGRVVSDREASPAST